MRKRKLILFIFSFILPLIFYRTYVFLNEGKVSFLRELTGLNVHHSHYGIVLVTAGVLLLVFEGVSSLSVVVSGLGLGTMLDGFISSLIPNLDRGGEIFNYGDNFLGTLVLFLGVVLIGVFLDGGDN